MLLLKCVLICSFSLAFLVSLQSSALSNTTVDDLSADVDKVDDAADKADDVGAGVLVFTSGAQIAKKLIRSV